MLCPRASREGNMEVELSKEAKIAAEVLDLFSERNLSWAEVGGVLDFIQLFRTRRLVQEMTKE